MKARGQAGVAVLLLLLLAFMPAIACAAPAAQLTSAEAACCRAMKSLCGQIEMPASHSCCHKEIGIASHHALTVKAVSVQDAWNAVSILPALFQHPAAPAAREPDGHSPPNSPSFTVSVLRI
ncbi:MAG TPA: hypothetical protein VGR96_19875 [Acidobacteriaceae bacterium]|nr:hypothetical protein [Acidobacteriaceae bacterium]